MISFNLIYLNSIYGKTQLIRDVYSIFSDDSLLKYFLKVEGELAKVQGELNIIPKDSAEMIHQIASSDFMDKRNYLDQTAIVGFPIVAVVDQLSKASGDHGKYVHWGATTQDIMDSAVMLQIKEVLKLIELELERIINSLLVLIKKYRDTVMVGRSQLQHALPITFGFKVAQWLSPVLEHLEQIRILRKTSLYLQFGGAVGTLASLDAGLKVRRLLAEKLELNEPVISWHTSREILVEIMHRITTISGTLGKIGKDISLMSQLEIGELGEQKIIGRGVSSTMPQKNNPISAQALIISAKNTAKSMNMMYEALLNDHERGTGVWQLEWTTIPDLIIHATGGIGIADNLLKNMTISPDKMEENILITNGFIMAESVMMKLASNIGKQQSHHLVHDLIERAQKENKTLQEVVMENEIAVHYSKSEIASWFDPKNYLGKSQTMIDKIILRAEHISSKQL